MARNAALILLLTMVFASGCYRVVRVPGTYGVIRPTPLRSGTYWSAEGGAVLSTGISASSGVAAFTDAPHPPVAYADGLASVDGEISGAVDLDVSASAGGAWSAEHGWHTSGGGLPGASSVASGETATSGPPRFGVDVFASAPSAEMVVTGEGSRLSSIASTGVTVACGGCALEGEIAALSRLRALGDGALFGDARVAGDGHVLIEAALAHDALPTARLGSSATEILVRVRGGAAPAAPPPLRIHLVIDASTSMETRWDAVKDAAVALVDTLRPQDELQIVVYGTDARVALPACRVGDGGRARRVIRGLTVGGRTNIEAGLRAAYADAVPSGGSIVLLLSDGVPQGGAATPAELGALAASAYLTQATTTVAIGLGTEFSAAILSTIASEGHGDFRIAPRIRELPALLSAEIATRGRVVARNVVIDLDLAEGVSLDEAAMGGFTLHEGHARIELPSVSAGAELTFALPVMVTGEGTVAAASASFVTASSPDGHGDKTLRVARSTAPVPSGGMRASLDLDLRRALRLASSALENGEAERAALLLQAHALEVEAVLAVGSDVALTERAHASRALSWSLANLVPEASWRERRSTAAAMLEWSVRLGR